MHTEFTVDCVHDGFQGAPNFYVPYTMVYDRAPVSTAHESHPFVPLGVNDGVSYWNTHGWQNLVAKRHRLLSRAIFSGWQIRLTVTKTITSFLGTRNTGRAVSRSYRPCRIPMLCRAVSMFHVISMAQLCSIIDVQWPNSYLGFHKGGYISLRKVLFVVYCRLCRHMLMLKAPFYRTRSNRRTLK
eukprot:5784558-Pyramimonas_sp.AAC.2